MLDAARAGTAQLLLVKTDMDLDLDFNNRSAICLPPSPIPSMVYELNPSRTNLS